MPMTEPGPRQVLNSSQIKSVRLLCSSSVLGPLAGTMTTAQQGRYYPAVITPHFQKGELRHRRRRA